LCNSCCYRILSDNPSIAKDKTKVFGILLSPPDFTEVLVGPVEEADPVELLAELEVVECIIPEGNGSVA
jgi:hypothetical protein